MKMTKTSGQRRTLSPEEKKSRVAREARRLFVQRGYHNVAMPDIVKASGVSIGAIYSYFPNKEALACHIHQETLAEFMVPFRRQLEGRISCQSRLRAFAEVVFDLTERDPEVMEYLLFMRHAEFMPGLAPICFTEPFRMLQEIIREGLESGELRSGSDVPSQVIRSGIIFTGVVLRAAELRLKCVLSEPLPEIADELLAGAWAGIRS